MDLIKADFEIIFEEIKKYFELISKKCEIQLITDIEKEKEILLNQLNNDIKQIKINLKNLKNKIIQKENTVSDIV